MKIAKFFKRKTSENQFEDVHYATESKLVFISDAEEEEPQTLHDKLIEINTKLENLSSDGLILKEPITQTEKALISYDSAFNNNEGAIKFSFIDEE